MSRRHLIGHPAGRVAARNTPTRLSAVLQCAVTERSKRATVETTALKGIHGSGGPPLRIPPDGCRGRRADACPTWGNLRAAIDRTMGPWSDLSRSHTFAGRISARRSAWRRAPDPTPSIAASLASRRSDGKPFQHLLD